MIRIALTLSTDQRTFEVLSSHAEVAAIVGDILARIEELGEFEGPLYDKTGEPIGSVRVTRTKAQR